MKRIFSLTTFYIIILMVSVFTALNIMLDFDKPDYFILLYLQPLCFGIAIIIDQKYISRIMSRISMIIIFMSYFCRMVLVPFFLSIGNYNTLLSDRVIGVHMSEAIILTCIELFTVNFILIYKSSKSRNHSLFKNYKIGMSTEEIESKRISPRLVVLIVSMVLYIIYILYKDNTIIRQTFSLMIGTPNDWYIRTGYRSIEDAGGDGVLGVMVTALLYFFWYVQALVPPILLMRIVKKKSSTRTKIFKTYIVACVIFMITTGTKAHSVECAVAFLILAYSVFGKKIEKSLKTIACIGVGVVFVAIFVKSGLTNSVSNISSVFASYFGGVQNLSAAIYAKTNYSGFGINNAVADVVNQIPIFGNRLRNIFNLGVTTNKLFNTSISSENIGQIIPSIGQGYAYFGLIFAVTIPIIAAVIAIYFDEKAIKESNVIKKNVYLIAAIMMSRAVVMTNLMSAVIYLFNTYMSLTIIWVGGKMIQKCGGKRKIDECKTEFKSYK